MSGPNEPPNPVHSDSRQSASNPARYHSPASNTKTAVVAATGIGGLLLGLILGGAGGFAIGSAQDSSYAIEPQAPRSAQSESSEQTNEPTDSGRGFPGRNVAVEAPGVTLTVLSVDEGTSASIREEGRRADVAEILTTNAAPGQKFVSITTEVENTGKVPWDLTCGAAIQAALFDPEERQFAAIEELYRVPGNPECNASTQPGQTVPMTWRYEVPEDVIPKYFGFREFSFDHRDDDSLTAIDLDR